MDRLAMYKWTCSQFLWTNDDGPQEDKLCAVRLELIRGTVISRLICM